MPDPEDLTGPSAATPSRSEAYPSDWGTAVPATRLDFPASPSRYALGEEIARGGMGVVYRATDTAFGREVAVKVLQEEYASHPAAFRRFEDEARITAQLQHPNIPAVFERGALPDGRPFLAMKLIQGDTLADLLSHRPDPSHGRGRFVAAFEQVCQAVAYAHSKGVVHRDLKPGNVMVGAFGEVQVMDWGLAKVLASRDLGGATADPDATNPPPQLHTPHVGGDPLTKAGSVLGTPAFMPPEQAIAALSQVDRRSDVFGLGGILAAVLTGRPPFAAESMEASRLMAARGKVEECFARLDACGADPELVALCKRCLSAEKPDRPTDADEVAKAVARLRLEADERARRAELDKVRVEGEKAAEQERRRKRRVLIGAGAFLALAALGGLSAVLVVQRRANADLTAKNDELDVEKERVERRFELAQKAIETFHTGVSKEALLKNDQLKGLRTQLLREAAGFYRELEGLLKDGQDDEASRKALAGAYFKLAILTAQIGDKEEALKAYRQALGLQETLAQDYPSASEFQIGLATSWCNLGHLLRDRGEPAEALPLYQRAIDRLGAVRKAQPRHPTARLLLRNSHAGRALALDRLGRHREAADDWRQVLALEAGATRTYFQLQLASSLARAGDRAEAARPLPERHKAADAHAARAVALLRQGRSTGFFRDPRAVAHMAKDEDLASLRRRADFRALLAEVGATPERLPMPQKE